MVSKSINVIQALTCNLITMTLNAVAHKAFSAVATECALQVGAVGSGVARRMQAFVHIDALVGTPRLLVPIEAVTLE